jgi:hypothetical protein
MEWMPHKKELWNNQKNPKRGKVVLCRLEGGIKTSHEIPGIQGRLATTTSYSIVAGYIKFAAGESDSPYFVTPGPYNGPVTHWCDCLPKDFQWPHKTFLDKQP